MKKLIVSLLLVLAVCFGTICVPTYAVSNDFIIENGILKKYNGNGGDVEIPNGVTEIGSCAFENCIGLTSVIIPDSVTIIHGAAFFECTNLTSVTFSNNLKTISVSAFKGCTSLTSATFTDGLTMIDDWAFWGCTSLTSVTIPSSLRALGYSAFYGCNQLTIYGSAGTFLESYAKERQIPFLPANSYKPVDTVFLDVPPNSYYADAVKWAVDRGITSGTSQTTFSPNATCSDAEIITFLWRAVGSPQPTIANPYYDLKESDFYYKAALWSTEAGLRSGSAFGGSAPCNRWVTVVYLWNLGKR